MALNNTTNHTFKLEAPTQNAVSAWLKSPLYTSRTNPTFTIINHGGKKRSECNDGVYFSDSLERTPTASHGFSPNQRSVFFFYTTNPHTNSNPILTINKPRGFSTARYKGKRKMIKSHQDGIVKL